MERKYDPLGDYYQLLLKQGLLPEGSVCGADLSREVRLVSCDSKQVVPGTLFIVKGAHFKEEYLLDAAERGAFVYVAERPFAHAPIPCITVTRVRRAMALFADRFYGSPSHRIRVVGITGTKGKTSVSYYLKHSFDAFERSRRGRESGLIGSIEVYDGAERTEASLTTPEPLELQRHLAAAADSGMEYLTMEVSSQALKYDRVVNVRLAAAVFLNIGLDHISPVEHPDFEDYFAAKLRIFEHSDVAVVNLDSDHRERVLAAARRCPRLFTFSLKDPAAAVFGYEVHKSGNDLLFMVKTARERRQFRITMPGLFNVQNALAAIAVCEALGIPAEAVAVGLEETRVPGRMEIYTSADGRVVTIVDFAHNGLSFQKLFESVREEYPDRRMVAVFGCPGGKAIDRRKDMGEAAGQWADEVILTEDDPAEEEVEAICREIAAYVTCPCRTVPDRPEAIRQAILGCEGPTVVVLAGKGAEKRQKRGTGQEPYATDGRYAVDCLKEYDRLHGRLPETTEAKD